MNDGLDDTPRYACSICKQSLDAFRSADHERQFIHTRGWIEYDHEPDPVPAEQVNGLLTICDFCYATPVVAVHEGNVIAAFFKDGPTTESEGGWATCARCDKLVSGKQLLPLLARVRTAMLADNAKALGFDVLPADERPQAIQYVVDHKATEIRTWLKTVHTRRSTIPPKVESLKPSRLPDVRDRLARFWTEKGGEMIHQTVQEQDDNLILPGCIFGNDDKLAVPAGFALREHCDDFAKRTAEHLLVSKCYWISKEFTARAVRAAHKLTDLSVTREDLPHPNGFMVFDAPIWELPLGDKTMPLTAVSWMQIPNGVWFTTYGRSESAPYVQSDAHAARYVQALGHFIAWSSGGGAFYGTYKRDKGDSHTNNRLATLLSVFMFMNTERVTDTREIEPSAKQIKRAKRTGVTNAKAPTVVVVDIRRFKRGEAATAGTPRGPMDYQMEISGHSKMQFYGPDRALRKRIWVNPYWKGPEDAPVRIKGEKEIVEVLR